MEWKIYRTGYLTAYSDTDHGDNETAGKSTTEVIGTYIGVAISWLSQKQSSVSISNTEYELVACREIV